MIFLCNHGERAYKPYLPDWHEERPGLLCNVFSALISSVKSKVIMDVVYYLSRSNNLLTWHASFFFAYHP